MNRLKPTQRGATTVEFALSLLVLLMFLLGIVDFSRMLFTWNGMAEATRAGARYAVVCDDQTRQADVLAKMQALMPEISAINVEWQPSGCSTSTCEGVTVSIAASNFRWISPVPGAANRLIPMPTFPAFLPREMMRQDTFSNAIC